MKILCEVDSGNNIWHEGFCLGCIPANNQVVEHKCEKEQSLVNSIKELKSTGFTAEEIMQMKREGLI